MKIVFDQGTPVPLRHALTGHTVSTAFELGWDALGNGELLRRAVNEFDILITTDQNLRYQQDLSRFQLAVLVLPTTSWPKIQKHVAQVIAAVEDARPGEYREIIFPVSAWISSRAPNPICGRLRHLRISLMERSAARAARQAPCMTLPTPAPLSLCEPTNHRPRTGVRCGMPDFPRIGATPPKL